MNEQNKISFSPNLSALQSQLQEARETGERYRLTTLKQDAAIASQSAETAQAKGEIDILDEQITRARAEITKLKFDHEHCTELLLFDEVFKERNALRAELSRRESDTAMLDWLEKCPFLYPLFYDSVRKKWEVGTSLNTVSEGDTIRTALATAMKEGK